MELECTCEFSSVEGIGPVFDGKIMDGLEMINDYVRYYLEMLNNLSKCNVCRNAEFFSRDKLVC